MPYLSTRFFPTPCGHRLAVAEYRYEGALAVALKPRKLRQPADPAGIESEDRTMKTHQNLIKKKATKKAEKKLPLQAMSDGALAAT